MSTKQTVLNYLGYGPQTSYALGVYANRPQPSVRRIIGSLRAEGHNIVTEGTGLDQSYRLVKASAPVAQADGDQSDAFDTDIDAGDSN
jgi:hypothetical protein